MKTFLAMLAFLFIIVGCTTIDKPALVVPEQVVTPTCLEDGKILLSKYINKFKLITYAEGNIESVKLAVEFIMNKGGPPPPAEVTLWKSIMIVGMPKEIKNKTLMVMFIDEKKCVRQFVGPLSRVVSLDLAEHSNMTILRPFRN